MRQQSVLREACRIHSAYYDDLKTKTPRWLDHHRQIFNAFRKGDARNARLALTTHIRESGEHLLALMDR
jgi:DNA-binding GntR family transcriptional regulator